MSNSPKIQDGRVRAEINEMIGQIVSATTNQKDKEILENTAREVIERFTNGVPLVIGNTYKMDLTKLSSAAIFYAKLNGIQFDRRTILGIDAETKVVKYLKFRYCGCENCIAKGETTDNYETLYMGHEDFQMGSALVEDEEVLNYGPATNGTGHTN